MRGGGGSVNSLEPMFLFLRVPSVEFNSREARDDRIDDLFVYAPELLHSLQVVPLRKSLAKNEFPQGLNCQTSTQNALKKGTHVLALEEIGEANSTLYSGERSGIPSSYYVVVHKPL